MCRKAVLAVCFVVLVFSFAGLAFGITAGQKIDIEGWVVSRQGQSLTVHTIEKGDIVVLLTSYTKVHVPRGLLNIRKKQMPVAALLPGLRIKVKGIGDTRSQVIAESVSFSGDDLKTAHAIQSGLTTVQNRVGTNTQQIAANQANIQSNQQQIKANQGNIQSNQQQIAGLDQRFADLTRYMVKYTTTVYFPPGSSTLSAGAKDNLRQFARQTQGLQGYVVQVKAHADSSGTAALNQDLSMRRAQSVMAYLQETCNIPLTHMLTPAAMGETGAVSSNRTPQGRADNRRVEVTVLVNRGLADNRTLYSAK
jgi:outer membrane protein OmpA-like peptidoglycan-associated protein